MERAKHQKKTSVQRCGWLNKDPLYIFYHDEEWGVPVWNDRKLFEFLVLESAQAGLSWFTILRRREAYRRVYLDFDVDKVAKFTLQDVEKLLQDASIIRNRAKIEASIRNAQKFLEVQDEFGSFARYSWSFVGGRPIANHRKSLKELPATTPDSDALAKDMKSRGFGFLGSTVLYAHMQAVGMVNDHTIDCFRHADIENLHRTMIGE